MQALAKAQPSCLGRGGHVRHVAMCSPRFSAAHTVFSSQPHVSGVNVPRPHVLARASSPEPLPEQQREEGPLDGALPALERWWSALTRLQKVYTVAAVLALAYLLPEAFVFFIMSLERLFVGSILAVEEAIVQLLFKTTAMGLTLGVGLLVLAGVYLLGDKKEEQQ